MSKIAYSWLLIAGFIILLTFTLEAKTNDNSNNEVRAEAQESSSIYMPLLASSKPFPVPQVVGSITLPGALCPNEVAYNEVAELWYVLNTGSSDVSLIQGDQWITNVRVGGRPTAVDVNRSSGYAYVTNLPEPAPPAFAQSNVGGLRPCGDPFGPGRDPACVSVFNKGQLVTQLDPQYEPFAVRVHPTDGQAYVTDLDSVVYLINGDMMSDAVQMETAENGLSGWIISLAHDLTTRLTYIPSWEFGILYIMDGNTIVDSFSYEGWGASDIEIADVSGIIYIANSQTDVEERPSNNISVLRRGSEEVTQLYTASVSQYVAVNQASGYAYVTNPKDNSVTILKDGAHVITVDVPGRPWDVEVNQRTGYAFVTLTDTDKVVVFKDAAIVAELDAGRIPFGVGVDEANGITYVINRTSKTAYDDLLRPYELCLNNPTVTVLR